MHDTRLRGLYAVTDGRLTGQPLFDAVRAALAGGVQLVQYRDKSGETPRRQDEAARLVELCHAQGALLLINDDTELALAVGADGVHLGQTDTPLASARARLGPQRIIGVSCNNRLEWARAAQQAGADYVAFGRFFPSSTKPDAPQAGLALLEQARQQLDLPIAAIGGITPDNAPQLHAAGADMLAVVNALFGQDDIETAARQLSRCFD
ncbi:thiamine phosphate synthase [Thiohalophilus sp.]|uniref:thiamine phosphate synthase n=1 Tax=Thiohalophilus sp. TaxID=3028392 RepID=UPI002ACDB3BA|nr:thiamine phosphate synthase [Thiohalophilus sp.]MDZ7805161.1 thiamine phosphate synthase [Thiohalophilus sp.]